MEVKNSYSEQPVRGLEGFVTTKRDKKYHGIGLKNVQHTVKMYNGFWGCTAEEGEFRALVELNIDK